MPINRPTECPRCGNTTYVVKQYISGSGNFYGSLNDEDNVDNSELHANLDYRNVNKYAHCIDCGKRLFLLKNKWEI